MESFPKQNKHDQDEKKHFITIRMKRNTIWPDGVTSDNDHHDVDADSGKHHLSFPQSPLQQRQRKEITHYNFAEVENNLAKSAWLAADQLKD